MDTNINPLIFSFLAPNIPRALPTYKEIEDSDTVLIAYGDRKVVRVGSHFVVKYGEGIDTTEGENMLYVQRTTNVKVPKVYAIYTDSRSGKHGIIMEFMEGETLASIWPNLNVTQKMSITSKLKNFYDELHQLPSPGYYGSLEKGPLLDDIFWTSEKIPTINGPFETENALNEAMAQKYLYAGRTSYKADYYRRCLPHVFRDHHPTFAHADCQRKNIIIRRVATRESYSMADQSIEDEFEVIIIDWEKAGWYPDYWDYSMAICSQRWDDDWCLYVQEFLSPYHAEAPWFQMLRFELWS